MFEHRNLIERKREWTEVRLFTGGLQHGMIDYFEVAVAHILQNALDIFRRERSEESETSGVESNDGDLLVAHLARHIKESSVASHADHKIGLEFVAFNDFAFWHVDFQSVNKEIVERLLDGEP